MAGIEIRSLVLNLILLLSTLPRIRSQAYCAPAVGLQVYGPAVPGNNYFSSPSASDCCSKCLSNIYCGAYAWSTQQSCNLYITANIYGVSAQFTSGIRTGAILTAPSSFQTNNFSAVNTIQLMSSSVLNGSVVQLNNLNYLGSAAMHIQPVELLQDSVNVCKQASFSVAFSFQTFGETMQYAANGVSFVILGTDSSYADLGLSNYFGWYTQNQVPGGMLAIEYDTYKDPTYNDPSWSHIGVNMNWAGVSNATYNTFRSGINLTDTSVKYSWIDYDGASSLLSVFISTSSSKPSSPVLTYTVSLCDVLRPVTCARCFATNSAYFGFTSNSNYYSESVSILSWSFETQWPAFQVGNPYPVPACGSQQVGYHYNGNMIPQYLNVNTPTAAQCCALCSSAGACTAYQWNSAGTQCALLYNINSIGTDGNSVSGQRTPDFVTTPTAFSFPKFSPSSPFYVLGSAVNNGSFIRLTSQSAQAGYAFLDNPIQVLQTGNGTCQPASFNASFSFLIGMGSQTFSSGITFQVIGGNAPIGHMTDANAYDYNLGLGYLYNVIPDGVAKGFQPGGMAVEFDTYQDQYINDLDNNHVGVDLGFNPRSVISQSADLLGIDLKDGTQKYAWVDYDGLGKMLYVYLNTANVKPKAALLQYSLDMCQVLRVDSCLDCRTVTTAYFGFSGSTSSYYELNDILSFSVNTSWPVIPSSQTPLYQPSLIPSGTLPLHLNKFFRYASNGYLSQKAKVGRPPTWEVATNWNWALDSVPAIKNSLNCSACYAFATTSVVESAYYLMYYTSKLKVPNLSEQQIVDCEGTGKCVGGWAPDALEYASSTGLVQESTYPYVAHNETCALPSMLGTTLYKPAAFEQVNFYGWFGLLLAVMQQPVLVHVEATSNAFVNYDSGIFSDPSCYSEGVNHNLVVVGYNLVNQPPYWILRNQWGTSWGENGYMRMQIQSGDGVCGINTLPGYYPVFKPPASDPCHTGNYPSKTGLFNVDVAPGRLNPCGGGKCSSKGGVNQCVCPVDFTSALNSDGTHTCVPVSPCTFYSQNPCNIGTCVNSVASPGTYTCLCPIGYEMGTLSGDNSTTCLPAGLGAGLQFYKVPNGYVVLCSLIYELYGIEKTAFIAQNKPLRYTCVGSGGSVTGGTVVNVTNSYLKGCKLPYAVNKGDTCSSIATLFQIHALSGAGSPNPDLDCSKLQLGQQVCIVRNSASNSAPPDIPLCTAAYLSKPFDTCASVISSQFNQNAANFFILNPGLYCGNFNRGFTSNYTSVGQQVCKAATNFGTIKKGCTQKYVIFRPGYTCTYIYYKYFCGKRSLFKKLNQGWTCESQRLFVSGSGSASLGMCAPLKC